MIVGPTDRVPPEHHFAAARYERVHFGPTREDGMRYLLRETRVLPGAASLRRFWLPLSDMPVFGVKRGLTATDEMYKKELVIAQSEGTKMISELEAEHTRLEKEQSDIQAALPKVKPGLAERADLHGRESSTRWMISRTFDRILRLRSSLTSIARAEKRLT